MYETDDAVVVLLELAGVDPNQTEISAEPHRLLVRGVRRERHAAQGAARTYHALEIPYGRFERSLSLPPGLDTEAAAASYQDGLLEITLPKRAPAQVRIAVKEGRSSAEWSSAEQEGVSSAEEAAKEPAEEAAGESAEKTSVERPA
jgi:HSP20 family protein